MDLGWSRRRTPLIAASLLLLVGPAVPAGSAQADALSFSYDVLLPAPGGGAIVWLNVSNAPATLSVGFGRQGYSAESSVRYLEAVTPGAEVADAGQGVWTLSSPGGTVGIRYAVPATVPWDGRYGSTPSQEQVAVYIGADAAYLMGPFFFIHPQVPDAAAIQVRFQVPPDWQVFTPYRPVGDHHEAIRITPNLVWDFVERQQIYMGETRFAAQATAGPTLLQMGILESDQSCEVRATLNSQQAVQDYVDLSAKAHLALADLFQDNPFPVYTMYTAYATANTGGYLVPGSRFHGNGYEAWPTERADYVVGHMSAAFMGPATAPLWTTNNVSVGIGEMFYGKELAMRFAPSATYEGRWYNHYLTYERYWNEPGIEERTDFYEQFAPMFLGLLLDRTIRDQTGDQKSLDEAFAHLYETRRDVNQAAGYPELEASILAATGVDSSAIFADYQQRRHLDVGPLMAPYRAAFEAYPEAVQAGWRYLHVEGHVEPIFAMIELSNYADSHVMGAILDSTGRLDQFADGLNSRRGEGLTPAEIEAAIADVTGHDAAGFLDRWALSYGALSAAGFESWLDEYLGSFKGKPPPCGGVPGRDMYHQFPIPGPAAAWSLIALAAFVLRRRFS